MADKKISEFTSVSKLFGDEEFVLAKDGETKKVTSEKIKTYVTPIVDSELSSTSTNAIQNKTVKSAIDSALNKADTAAFNLFVKLFNDAGRSCGASYNSSTGLFDINGLSLTYDEAVAVYNYSRHNYAQGFSPLPNRARTNFPYSVSGAADTDKEWLSLTSLCQRNATIEVLALAPNDNTVIYPSEMLQMCYYATKLKRIIGAISVSYSTTMKVNRYIFWRADELEQVLLKNVIDDVFFSTNSKLNLKTFQYLMENAKNTAPITIHVHADVYAKLLNDTTNAAAAKLTEEELASWKLLMMDCAANDIAFAEAR